MDELDRMLQELPQEPVPEGLAVAIVRTVHRRDRRRQALRRAGASVLGAAGVWLLWPAVGWLTSNELFASGASWLASGLSYLDAGSLDSIDRLWASVLGLQGAIGSAFALSLLLGASRLCGAIFLGIDPARWLNVPRPRHAGANGAVLASGIHL